jgi:segregation and condensation protein B
LSGAARETLAIVAYRQPITRADVEAVRGVQCSELLRLLMEKGLVRIAGREPSLGRPVLYGTTKKFLQVFGLKSLKELPQADQLREPKASRGQAARDATAPEQLAPGSA